MNTQMSTNLIAGNRRRSVQRYIAEMDEYVEEHVADNDVQTKELIHHEPFVVLSLVLISAAIASAIAFGVNTAVARLGAVKAALVEPCPLLGSALWTACLLLLVRLLVKLVPQSAGSGLPEVRTMLSGFTLHDILGWRVGAAKAAGLALAMAAGLPLGTEGPFVHVSACTVAELRHVRPFSGLVDDKHVRFTLLMAMVSVGSGATLTAPIGGALLGLELMLPHTVDMHSYKSLLLAASIGSLCAALLKMTLAQQGYAPLFSTDVDGEEYRTARNLVRLLLLALPLAGLCGLLGGAFVHFQDRVARLYKGLRARGAPLLAVDGALLAAVGTSVVLLAAFEPHFGMGTAVILKKLFGVASLPDTMMGVGLLPGLLLLLAAKFAATAATIRLPLPGGCVAPSLVLGAVAGRAYAQLLWAAGLAHPQDAASLAIIGASAFTASVCRTYSVVIVVFELLDVPSMILPLSLATLLSMAVGDQVSPSIFDSISSFKGLPNLVMRTDQWSKETVETLMQTSFDALVLPRMCRVSYVKGFLQQATSGDRVLGAVGIVERYDLQDSPYLLGTVKTSSLADFFEETQAMHDQVIDLFRLAADSKMLGVAIQLKPGTLLKDACLVAQTRHNAPGASLFICDHGKLTGIITDHDLRALPL